jgi:poly(3-hydroxybutyrate) depolymerase
MARKVAPPAEKRHSLRRSIVASVPLPELERGQVVVGGTARDYFFAPPTSTPAAVVLCLHGRGTWPNWQAWYSGMERLARDEDVLVVFPARSFSIDRRGYSWDDHADLPYLVAVVDGVHAQFSTADRRVCMCGLSAGTWMASSFAAAHAGDVAALGAVAGLRAPQVAPVRPVAVVAFHGLADRALPYRGGKGSPGRRGRDRGAPALLQTAHLAAEVSSCDGTDIQTRLDRVYLEACGCPGSKSGVVVHWGRWPAGRTSSWQAFPFFPPRLPQFEDAHESLGYKNLCVPISRFGARESKVGGRLPLGMGFSEAGSNEDHMAIQAHALRARDDRYLDARVRQRAALTFEANPSRRTCTGCGELVEMLREAGGWSVCPLCGRYA